MYQACTSIYLPIYVHVHALITLQTNAQTASCKIQNRTLEDVTSFSDLGGQVQVPLTQTTLQVRIGNVEASAFVTNIGSPQGDSLSPILFNCYYEAAMRDFCQEFPALRQEDSLLQ